MKFVHRHSNILSIQREFRALRLTAIHLENDNRMTRIEITSLHVTFFLCVVLFFSWEISFCISLLLLLLLLISIFIIVSSFGDSQYRHHCYRHIDIHQLSIEQNINSMFQCIYRCFLNSHL